jgi:branched-subunit amino acid ABC-type transport system permease component
MVDQYLQYILNGIISGGMLALPAVAFSLLYGILRFPNFAIGTYITAGGFIAYAANVTFKLPIPIAFVIAMLLCGFLGVGVDQSAFRPMRQRRPLTLAIVSIGVSFIVENIARFIWGNELKSYDLPVLRGMEFGGLRIGKEQLVILFVSLVFMVLVQCLLKFSRLGKAMRAVSDNAMLASVKGIDSEGIILRTSFLGAALTGAAGVMVGIDSAIDPLMGFKLILSIFAAAILGGIGSATTAVGGAFFVGLAEEISTIWLPATYKSAIGFAMIVLILLFRPAGLFRRTRVI